MELPVASSIFELLGGFFVAGAGLGCLYLLMSAIVLLRQKQDRRQAQTADLRVTILKPLHGDEPDLLRRLASFCSQNYAAPVQLVFGVHDAADPAVEVVTRLQALYPDQPIALRIDTREHGSNRKISNVINMSMLAKHPAIVLSDSDIEVDADYLAAIVGELQQPDVGAVTCLYHGIAEKNVWGQLSQLGINAQFLPNAVTAIKLGLARPCFGSTIALHPDVLKRIGGFSAFADCLADDYAIGEAVHSAGYKMTIPSFSVGHACSQSSLRDVFMSDLRSARTIKLIDPIGYFGSIITNPLPLALLGALMGGTHAVMMVAMAIACRIALCVCVERTFSLPRHSYWLLPIRDLLSFGVFVTSFFGNAVSWRGYKYRVLSDGSLIQKSNTVQS